MQYDPPRRKTRYASQSHCVHRFQDEDIACIFSRNAGFQPRMSGMFVTEPYETGMRMLEIVIADITDQSRGSILPSGNVAKRVAQFCVPRMGPRIPAQRATPWVFQARRYERVLKERRISSRRPPAPDLCGVPSERENRWCIAVPRALPWAGMQCPVGAENH